MSSNNLRIAVGFLVLAFGLYLGFEYSSNELSDVLFQEQYDKWKPITLFFKYTMIASLGLALIFALKHFQKQK